MKKNCTKQIVCLQNHGTGRKKHVEIIADIIISHLIDKTKECKRFLVL